MTQQKEAEPDMEDLLAPARKKLRKLQDADAGTVSGSSSSSSCLHHAIAAHDLQPCERRSVREELLRWYDAHRRKLPWRGDMPPFLSTAAHTKQRAAAVSGTLDAFFKREPPQDESTNGGEHAREQQQMSGEEQLLQLKEEEKQQQRRVSPYETWVSEIMLQQTRVDTVVDYFLRWTDKFPTVAALASGSEEDVNSLWAGLGYYRRARMLHSGAKYVVEHFGGELPSTIDQLLTIPGIGPYTAGAISSIAFGNREPLVDGNVIRVLARLRAVGADPKNKHLIKFTWKAAGELVEECERPGELNQALMELGATNPECGRCPVRASCLAYEEVQTRKKKSADENCSEKDACTICDASRVDEWNEKILEVTKYPLKAKKGDAKNEVICVSVVSYCDKDDTTPPGEAKVRKAASKKDEVPANWRFLMTKRPDEGLLAGQWEFIHKKVDDGDKIPAFAQRKKLMDSRLAEILGSDALSTTKLTSSSALQQRRDLGELTHIFSHVKHHMGVEHVQFAAKPSVCSAASSESLRWMTTAEMQQLGITTGVKKILGLVARATGFGSMEAESSRKPKKTNSSSSSKSSSSNRTPKPKVNGKSTSTRATSAKARVTQTLTAFLAK